MVLSFAKWIEGRCQSKSPLCIIMVSQWSRVRAPKLNTSMYIIFLPIGEAVLDPWRSHRLFSAVKTFAFHINPLAAAQAVYSDHERQGWTFSLTTSKARDQLAAFHDALRGKVLADCPSRHDPVEVGGLDAASAIDAR